MKVIPNYRILFSGIGVTLLALLSPSIAFSDLFQWTGSDSQSNGSFSNPSCWYPEAVPYHWDTAYFNQPKTYLVWFSNDLETWDMELHTGDMTFLTDAVPLFRQYTVHHGIIKGGTLRVNSMKLVANDFLDIWGLEAHLPCLTIEDGGGVACQNMKLGGGQYNLSMGILNIAGVNSSLTVSNTITAGIEGTGEVHVTQGTLQFENCIIGSDDWGEVTIQGSKSIFTGNYIAVGAAWAGSLKILDGAKGTASHCDLGVSPNPPEYPDSSGTLRVDGSGSGFSTEELHVGGSFAGAGGFGRIYIDNGGQLAVSRKLKVWPTPVVTGSKNRIELTNGTLIADEIELGLDTEFTGGPQSVLRVNRITEPSILTLYRLEAGHNIGVPSTIHSMQITGQWTIQDALLIGIDSDMSLQIVNNGEVSSLTGIIAEETGSTGMVLVSGADARWDNTSHLYVANSGEGVLTIQNGAEVTDVFGYIGHQEGSSGSVLVDGLGSRWKNTFIFIGDVSGSEGGSGDLTIQNLAEVDTLYNVLVGDQGRLIVKDATLRADEVELTGNGILDIQGRCELYLNELDVPFLSYINLGDSSLYVGQGTSSGRFTIDGGENLVLNGLLQVGWDTPAVLTISDGGQMNLTSTQYGYLGKTDGPSGTITVTGSGSFLASLGSLAVGSVSGNGQLNVFSGASVSIDNVLDVFGSINLEDAFLRAWHIICSPAANFQSEDSTLQVALFNGNLQHNGGLLDIDWNGLMECTGDLAMNASMTRIEIGGTNPYSGYEVLKVGGAVHWSGTLEILFRDGFIPRAGQVFRILEFDHTQQTGWFDEIVLPELPLPLAWNTGYLYSQGEISISAEAFVVGWGKDTVGQTEIPRLLGTTDMAAGWTHGVMLDRLGFVLQWGFNPYGTTVPANNDFIAVDAGGYFSLGLRQTGNVIVAWGDNRQGQCNVPAGSYQAMAAGWSHALAIRTDGSLVGWGSNSNGEINVPSGYDFKAVAAGQNFSIALKTDGSLTAWGNNDAGQLNVPAGNDFTAIDAGVYHGLALKINGSIVAWGNDNYGQVSQVPSGYDFCEIAAGSFHNVARHLDGSIVSWGKNDKAQAVCPQGNGVLAIAAGDDFSVMLTMIPPMPVLNGPAEGEVLIAGMPYEIQWKTWQQVQDIDISYSVDNGSTFLAVTPANNGNWGEYLWQVPQPISATCYIRIQERLNPDVFAVSGCFEIREPIYVDADGDGNNNGTSWQDAYVSLQDALAASVARDVLWVASSLHPYLPDEGTELTKGDRNLSFNLKSDVKLYGGFPAGGSTWDQRDPVLYPTTLSGDLNQDDLPEFVNYTENSIRVVAASNVNANARLDGFFVRGANGISGCGMRNITASPTLVSCVFEYNLGSSTGAGLHNVNDSHPIITGCAFRHNRAGDSGGGLTNSSGCYCVIESCTFENNWAKWGGGGIYNYNAAVVIKDCQFQQNTCDAWGGGVHNTQSGSAVLIEDCRFIENTAKDGGGVYNRVDASPIIKGCVFLNNQTTTGAGGGIFANHSNVTLDRCTFVSNQSGSDAGGVYANDYSSIVLANSIFSGNSSLDEGGAVFIRSYSQAKIHHCTFYGNRAVYGGAIDVWGNVNSFEIVNSILWNNSASYGSQLAYGSNSYVSVRWVSLENGITGVQQDGTGGLFAEAVLEQNPQLNSPVGMDGVIGTLDDDLRLKPGSGCIDTGNKNLILPLFWEDLAGRYRLFDGTCDGSLQTDRGAYEFAQKDFGSFDGNCTVDLNDLVILIDQWLNEEESLSADIAPCFGDGLVDLRDFAVLANHWLE